MMKTSPIKLILMAVLIFSITALSCKKDKNLLVADATVIDAGNPAADGCGWMIKIDDTLYSPINLPENYKKTDSKVKIDFYVLTTKYQCGFAPISYSQIDIKSIRNK
jgi:hypothetical protein